MDKRTAKPWEKPWTSDEIRGHSSNWNLAGDSGLLNHLQQFSQDLLARTHATEVALEELVEDLKTTSTSVQNATNTFLFLANTQFVENRVYDDDEKETPPEERKNDVNEPKTKEEKEAEVFQKVKLALDMGLALLDTHFDAVEVPASDSEEEESSASVGRLVLKPKNPYQSRPLPYLIGSREFMEDDKVGLGEMFSDTEESPDQNAVQSSESDEEMEHDELIVVPKRPASLSFSDLENSEPESDRSETLVKQKKLKTSSSVRALGEDEEEKDMFGQESPPEADEVVKGGMKSAFSDELSSKLAVAKSQNVSERADEIDNMFVPSCEPEDETSLFGKASHSFTERQGLFDDLDDWQSTSDSLWKNKSILPVKPALDLLKDSQSQKPVDASHISGTFADDNEVDGMFTSLKQNENSAADFVKEAKIIVSTPQGDSLPKAKTNALFDPADEVDDLFSQKSKVTGTAGNSTLFGKEDFEDDDIFALPSSSISSQPGPSQNSTKKKKLPGAVPVFSNVNLFGDISPVVQNDSTVENNAVERTLETCSDLHQESSSGVGIDTVLKSGAIESILVSKTPASTTSSLKPKTKKLASLFDDSDSGDDELLFSSTSSTSSRSRRSQGSGDVLGSTIEKRTLPKKELFEDSLLFGAGSNEEPEVDIFISQNNSNSKVGSLFKENSFGDSEVIGDSLSSRKVTSSIFDDIDEVDDIFAVPEITIMKTPNNVINNSPSSLGKLPLFSNDSSDVNYISSNKVNKSKRHEGFIPEQEEPSLPDMSGDSSSVDKDETSSINTSLFLRDTPTQCHVVKDNFQSKEVVKNSNPAISQKPKVPTKPILPTMSLHGNSSSVQSSASEIDSNVEKSQNICVSEARRSQDVENTCTSRISKHKSNNDSEVGRIGDNQTRVSSTKPEPPRTLNIRKTTDIVFESPLNEDDLFESSLPGTCASGKESINVEQSKNNTLSSSNFSKLLDNFNSTSANNRLHDQTLDTSPTSNENRAASATDVYSSDVKELPKVIIDPRTLLPGAKPPSKTVTSDGAVGFDKPAETTSTLHSAGKERVKIQVKRRPQTRRARQEALRASSIEYDQLDSVLISQIVDNKYDVQKNLITSCASSRFLMKNSTNPKVFESDDIRQSPIAEKSTTSISERRFKNNSDGQASVSDSDQLFLKNESQKNILSDYLSGNSNALSPLTDEEDLFAVPHDLPFDESNIKEVSNDGNNLFGGAPVLSPLDMRTQTDSFSVLSSLKTERDRDVVAAKDDTLHSPLEKTLQSADLFKDGIFGPKVSISPTALDKSSCKNSSSIPDSNLSDSKWLDHNDLEGLKEKGVLFDDYGNNNGSDDDLFSARKPRKSGKKPEKDSGDIHQKSSLFSSDVNSASDSMLQENKHRVQFYSEEFLSVPTQGKLPLQSDSETNLPSVSKNVSSDQRSSDDSPIHFSKRISDSSQSKDNDCLFTSNISTKDVKTSSSVNITDSVIVNAPQEKMKSHVESLFGDDSIESDDLFGSSSAPKMPVSGSSNNFIPGHKLKDTKESLFDDGDDDIFTVGLNKNRGPNSDTLFPNEDSSQNAEKDIDDLFSKQNSNDRNKGTKPLSAQKVQSFEDPLMVFNK